MLLRDIGVFLTGTFCGFLGGLFGKGGSAIATPLLSLLGFPGFVAVASPLSATVPGTFLASAQYWRSQLLDWEVVWWSAGAGIPASVAGSYLTRYLGSRPLLVATALIVLGFGLSFLLMPRERGTSTETVTEIAVRRPSYWHLRLVAVALSAGMFAGVLANAGGLVLAPGFARFLKLSLKQAFACSLAVSCILAVPGTVVHAYLGHISWTVAGLVALGMVPFSRLGARLAIGTGARRLERWYGLGLTALGAYFLWQL
jgi:uncharacterized membrane protein YfcA